MFDTLVTLFHFLILCVCGYLVLKRYGVSIAQEIREEQVKKEHLHNHYLDLQKQLEKSQHDIQEQTVVCDLLIGKVQLWKENFEKEKTRECEERVRVFQEMNERRKKLLHIKEINALQKELFPQALEKARARLQAYYTQAEAQHRYHEVCLSRCEMHDRYMRLDYGEK